MINLISNDDKKYTSLSLICAVHVHLTCSGAHSLAVIIVLWQQLTPPLPYLPQPQPQSPGDAHPPTAPPGPVREISNMNQHNYYNCLYLCWGIHYTIFRLSRQINTPFSGLHITWRISDWGSHMTQYLIRKNP